MGVGRSARILRRGSSMGWGSLLRFGGAPVEEGKLLSALLRGPLTPRYLFLSCDLDSEPGTATDARGSTFQGRGGARVSLLPFPLGQCGGKASFPPELHSPFSVFDYPVFS